MTRITRRHITVKQRPRKGVKAKVMFIVVVHKHLCGVRR